MAEPQEKIATEEFDFITNYIPLPPERSEEWERAMRVLNEIIEQVFIERRNHHDKETQ